MVIVWWLDTLDILRLDFTGFSTELFRTWRKISQTSERQRYGSLKACGKEETCNPLQEPCPCPLSLLILKPWISCFTVNGKERCEGINSWERQRSEDALSCEFKCLFTEEPNSVRETVSCTFSQTSAAVQQRRKGLTRGGGIYRWGNETEKERGELGGYKSQPDRSLHLSVHLGDCV